MYIFLYIIYLLTTVSFIVCFYHTLFSKFLQSQNFDFFFLSNFICFLATQVVVLWYFISLKVGWQTSMKYRNNIFVMFNFSHLYLKNTLILKTSSWHLYKRKLLINSFRPKSSGTNSHSVHRVTVRSCHILHDVVGQTVDYWHSICA